MEYPKIETLFIRDEKTHKVDPEKIKNPVYSLIKTWKFTEKIDGTNVRVIWDGARIRVSGRTDNADLKADLIQNILEIVTPEKMKLSFPLEIKSVNGGEVIIFGEGYGAGIRSGAGYSLTKKFIVFDVLVDKWWLGWENVCNIADKLGLETVPYIGDWSLERGIALARAGFFSLLAKKNTGIDCLAEGIVGRTVEPLFDKRGNRLIVKLKTIDF